MALNTEQKSNLFILLSAVLWALQPSIFLISGRAGNISEIEIIFFSCLGQLLIPFLLMSKFTERKEVFYYFKEKLNTKKIIKLLFFDGILIFSSYLFLIRSSSIHNLATSATLFDSWPIIFAAMMYYFMPGKILPWQMILAILLLLLGFVFLNFNLFLSGSNENLSVSVMYPLASAICMGVSSFYWQFFIRKSNVFDKWNQFHFIFFLRPFFPLLLSLLYLYFFDSNITLNKDSIYVFIIGIIVVITSYLFHFGVLNSKSHTSSLISLMSPIMAPLFLFITGYGFITITFLTGATFIVVGIAIVTLNILYSSSFTILMIGTLIAGTYVVFSFGLETENYFQYLHALAIFYGLLQASSINRLFSRFSELKYFNIELNATRKNNICSPAERREIRILREKINYITKDQHPWSELLLLSVLGGASCLLILGLRENSLAGDTIAFVLSSSALFLITVSWILQIRIHNFLDDDYVQNNLMSPRYIGYVICIALFIWFFLIILYKNTII